MSPVVLYGFALCVENSTRLYLVTYVIVARLSADTDKQESSNQYDNTMMVRLCE